MSITRVPPKPITSFKPDHHLTRASNGKLGYSKYLLAIAGSLHTVTISKTV